MKPPEVLFVTPVTKEVREYEEFTGRTTAENMVEIRSRVSGYLQEAPVQKGSPIDENAVVKVNEGADIKAGDILFQIDPRPFEAEVARAEANMSQFDARRDRLDRQVKRAESLREKEAISQDEYEAILFDRNEAEASYKSAAAARDIAQLNLEFTKVRSPIDGRVSRRLIDRGNLVRADETLLANVVSLDPIYVYFDVDERTVLRLRRLVQSGSMPSMREVEATIDIALADEEEFKLSGKVTFVDNQVDAATGTLRYRAEISNPNKFLTPGLFVRLRFPIGDAQPSLLIPEEALATDQGRRYVYVIGEDNKVIHRQVEVGVLSDGNRVIQEGLKSGERVVVAGMQRLRPGAEVTPKLREAEKATVNQPVAHAQ